jgi:hypothetical protein
VPGRLSVDRASSTMCQGGPVTEQNVAAADQPFVDAAGVALTLLGNDAVRDRWPEPSALPAMSVGALACHLGRQAARASELLVSTAALPRLPAADDHYARAAWVRSTSPSDPANDRNGDDADAALGHDALVERTTAHLAEVRRILAAGEARETVPIPWQGWALPRPEFLLTRLVELIVHSADLAASVDRPAPEFPDAAFRPVSELLVRLAARRHGQGPVVGTLSRRERTAVISAF